MATRKTRVKYLPPDPSIPGNVRVEFVPLKTVAENLAWWRAINHLLELGRKARLEENAAATAAGIGTSTTTASPVEIEAIPCETKPRRIHPPRDPGLLDSALHALLSMRQKMTLKEIRIALDVPRDEAKGAVDRLIDAGRVEVVRRGANGTYRWLSTP